MRIVTDWSVTDEPVRSDIRRARPARPSEDLAWPIEGCPPHVVGAVRDTLRRAGLDCDPGETGAMDDDAGSDDEDGPGW